ncbi:MAG: cadherin-like beta sandwich domain-containing protein [Bacteroidales bacterium]
MKKLFTLITLLSLSAVVFCQIQNDLSQVIWHKHEAPILLPGEEGNWDGEVVFSPSVLRIDDTYHMWYSGMDAINIRIGHATSVDGLVWVKDENNPVIDLGEPGSFDDTRAYLPTVAYDGTTFHLYYVTDKSVNGEQLGYATSDDGISWTKQTGEPIFQDENGNPFGGDIWRGDVYYYEDVFHMWAGVGISENTNINYFTSPDGITWTAYENNPVLIHSQAGEWDYPRTQVSTVFEMGGEFHMWYCGGHYGNWEIGYASSPDGLSWTRAENNPVLPVGELGEWDEKSTHFPTVMAQPVDDNYKLRMWYGGTSTEGFGGIGYAETLSDDASLSDLTVSEGTLSPFFDAGTFEYSVDLPAGTTTVTTTASTNEANATVTGDGAIDVSSGSGTSTIVVTAEDGTTTQTYTIEFTVIVGVGDMPQESILVYPTITSEHFNIDFAGKPGLVKVYDITGKLVLKIKARTDIETIYLQNEGMYIFRLENENGSRTVKVFKMK